MGKADVYESDYLENEEIFADLVNGVLYNGEQVVKKEKMEEHRDRYEDLSREAKILLSKLTNIKKIPGVEKEEFERGEFDMCKAFEDMKEEGKIEGRAEGKIEGRAEGKAEERENGIRSALNIIKEFSGSREQGISALIKEYSLSRENAMEKVALYWYGNTVAFVDINMEE